MRARRRAGARDPVRPRPDRLGRGQAACRGRPRHRCDRGRALACGADLGDRGRRGPAAPRRAAALRTRCRARRPPCFLPQARDHRGGPRRAGPRFARPDERRDGGAGRCDGPGARRRLPRRPWRSRPLAAVRTRRGAGLRSSRRRSRASGCAADRGPAPGPRGRFPRRAPRQRLELGGPRLELRRRGLGPLVERQRGGAAAAAGRTRGRPRAARDAAGDTAARGRGCREHGCRGDAAGAAVVEGGRPEPRAAERCVAPRPRLERPRGDRGPRSIRDAGLRDRAAATGHHADGRGRDHSATAAGGCSRARRAARAVAGRDRAWPRTRTA